jgi:hypothetical protein
MLSDGIAVITGLVAMADNENRETASAAKRIFFIVVFVYFVINLLIVIRIRLFRSVS